MTSLRIASLFLLLAPLTCGDGKSSTTEEGSSSSSGTTGTPSETTSTGTGVITTTTPTTGNESTADAESTAAGTTGTSTGATSTTGEDLCAGDTPHVLLSTTMGDMVIKLDAVNAPNTVGNFLDYVETGFYEGTIFHRVAKDFVIQGGGLTADLEEKSANPPIALETSPALLHVDGAIAMARTDDPDSATSQFYLCDGAQPGLDGEYAVFGVLVEGFDVRDAIADVAVAEEDGFMDVPVEDVIITMASCVAPI